jgi:hypothetical protein
MMPQSRENELSGAMQNAVYSIDVMIDILQSPKTDLEMTINSELQSINRRLSIIAAAMNITLEDE